MGTIQELLPEILKQIGPDQLGSLQELLGGMAKKDGKDAAGDDDEDDDVPPLVEGTFDKPAEEDKSKEEEPAKEVLNKNYNSKCDIWSCGVITYILLSGMPPFNGQSDQEIMKKVRAGSFSFDDKVWSNISDNCKDFITKLLTYKQEERPTAAEALQHPWIVELSTTVVDEKSAQDALSNLKSFKVDSSMKQATFAFIASQLLSKQERDGLAKVFKAFDKNGDGKLSYEEVKDGYLDHYGKVMSDEEVHAMFDSVDTDKSGFIDYSEFVVAAMAESQLTSNDKLQAAFKMFDKDGSGIISGDEIREVLSFGGTSQMSKEQIDTIIKQVDENGDGEIL